MSKMKIHIHSSIKNIQQFSFLHSIIHQPDVISYILNNKNNDGSYFNSFNKEYPYYVDLINSQMKLFSDSFELHIIKPWTLSTDPPTFIKENQNWFQGLPYKYNYIENIYSSTTTNLPAYFVINYEKR